MNRLADMNGITLDAKVVGSGGGCGGAGSRIEAASEAAAAVYPPWPLPLKELRLVVGGAVTGAAAAAVLLVGAAEMNGALEVTLGAAVMTRACGGGGGTAAALAAAGAGAPMPAPSSWSSASKAASSASKLLGIICCVWHTHAVSFTPLF